MRAVQQLESEHRSIAGVLLRFERWIDETERNRETDRETAERLLEFFERVVDGQHQEKEERIFLPCLARRVTGIDAPQVHRLFREHIEDRKLLAVMRDNLEGACYGEPNCIDLLVRYGRLFLLHERQHACREERGLFALAERLLGPEDDREILQGFRHIEALWEAGVCASAHRLSTWLDQRGAAVPG